MISDKRQKEMKYFKDKMNKVYKLSCDINRKEKSGKNLSCEQYKNNGTKDKYKWCDTCKHKIENRIK